MIAYRILVPVYNEWLDKEFAQELFLVRTTSEAITSSVFVFNPVIIKCAAIVMIAVWFW